MNFQIFTLILLSITLLSCSKTEDPEPEETDSENFDIVPQFDVIKTIDIDEIWNIIETYDGGYIGISHSGDYSIIKFDSEFNILWDVQYGGSEGDYAASINQLEDSKYLVYGYSKSSDGDVSASHGGYDIWICKLDSDGSLIWEKSYGGSQSEILQKEGSLIQTDDGGYIFIGSSDSDDGDISQNHGKHDVWLVKISSSGEIEHEKTFGGTEDDFGRKILATDNHYIISLKSNSTNGDFNAPGCWVVQIDKEGNIAWKTNLEGLNSGSINTTIDGNLVSVNTSSTAYLLHTLNSEGKIVSGKTISFNSISSKQPFTTKVLQTSDKGFIVIGTLGGGNDADAILFRVTPKINLIYQKIYEGNDLDMSASLFPINNNQFIYHFISGSNNLPDINHSSWLVSAIIKLEEDGN